MSVDSAVHRAEQPTSTDSMTACPPIVLRECAPAMRCCVTNNSLWIIIESGLPKDLVQTFDTLFAEKIERTHEIAKEVAKYNGLLEERFR